MEVSLQRQHVGDDVHHAGEPRAVGVCDAVCAGGGVENRAPSAVSENERLQRASIASNFSVASKRRMPVGIDQFRANHTGDDNN